MEELSEKLYEAITNLLDEGDELVERGKYKEAIAYYEEAMNRLPEPKEDWTLFDTIAICIGDSYYEMGEYIVADRFYTMSLTRGSGIENPYVWYVKGRNLIKLDNKEEGVDALMRAYMLDGTDVFDTDDGEFLSYIEPYIGAEN
ncbi:MAG: tetratricopeptide repeat protein [Prevotella nigrescens]|jgi:putative tetratricopeptide repeat-containing domain protein|uniref:tetratricopeptide repeat protein n=1 Tax=Prevotella nigrescens TaxID=28133 RepID=UPI00360816C6